MSKWQSDYSSRTGNTVTYGAIGSGGGIEQITAGTVDFGASDAPLTPDQQKAAPDVLMIPWALSATDPVYNVAASRTVCTSTARRSPTSSWATSRPGTTRRSRS